MNVDPDAYLEMADFWYKARGNHENRSASPEILPRIQSGQRNLRGRARSRRSLCQGGALLHRRGQTSRSLTATADAQRLSTPSGTTSRTESWHINGGIGTRHDIEGFDTDYDLPNDAYLETCAAIALAFWAGEMNLLSEKSEYFDVFERALYNNIIDGVGEDFRHFFYQNPLVSDGGITRWEWHGGPAWPAYADEDIRLAREVYLLLLG